jgi:hypothetical protein
VNAVDAELDQAIDRSEPVTRIRHAVHESGAHAVDAGADQILHVGLRNRAGRARSGDRG